VLILPGLRCSTRVGHIGLLGKMSNVSVPPCELLSVVDE
jgi:hypothetical protein